MGTTLSAPKRSRHPADRPPANSHSISVGFAPLSNPSALRHSQPHTSSSSSIGSSNNIACRFDPADTIQGMNIEKSHVVVAVRRGKSQPRLPDSAGIQHPDAIALLNLFLAGAIPVHALRRPLCCNSLFLSFLCSQGRAAPDPCPEHRDFYRYAQQLFRGFPVLLSARYRLFSITFAVFNSDRVAAVPSRRRIALARAVFPLQPVR